MGIRGKPSLVGMDWDSQCELSMTTPEFNQLPPTYRIAALCQFFGLTYKAHIKPTRFYVPALSNILLAELHRRIVANEIDLLDCDDKSFDYRNKRYVKDLDLARQQKARRDKKAREQELTDRKKAIVKSIVEGGSI
jgi:hypothetical protein